MAVTFLEFPLWSSKMSVFYISEKVNQRKIDCFNSLFSFISSLQRKKRWILIEIDKRHNKKVEYGLEKYAG